MQNSSIRLGGSFLILSLLLASCSSLPRSGPNDAAVVKGAAIRATTKDETVGIDYVLLDINKNILASFAPRAQTSIRDSFGGGRGAAPNIPLGIGDVVEVSIFEAQAGGLFIPTEVAGSRPGNFVTLPAQTIDRSGTLTIPYAGKVAAAGRSKEAVEQTIAEKLSNRAIEPQVIISMTASHSSEVAVLGDVNRSGKIEITSSGSRVLDVIAAAGGITTPNVETYITMQRQGRVATASYERLQSSPQENIYVAPGDTILVNRDRRTFTAFGATGLNGRFDFDESNITLSEALGKAGGLLDSRANPSSVLLYRVVDRKTLQQLGVNLNRFPSGDVPVVFRANLKDPAAFFATQKFGMQDKDVLYISNSDSVELVKFLNIVGSVTSSAYSGREATK